jgi:hypothetical protein
MNAALCGIRYGITAAVVVILTVGSVGCAADLMSSNTSNECVIRDGVEFRVSLGGGEGEDCIWINGMWFCKDGEAFIVP